MQVFIIRHGQACNGSISGYDQDRKLTEQGHAQAKALGTYLANHKIPPTVVIASPFQRAQETAGDIWDALGMANQSDDRLGADRGLTEMLAVLGELQSNKHESVAIVGHMPTVARLFSLLTTGPGEYHASLQTGELLGLQIEADELIGHAKLTDRFRFDN